MPIKKNIEGGGGGLWRRSYTLPTILIVMALLGIVHLKGTYPLFGGEQVGSAINLTLDQMKTKDDDSDWEIKPLAIMKSRSQGFRPVYIYSNVTPDHMDQYSQEKQDQIILALTKANDIKANLNPRVEPPFFVDLAANDALVLSNTFFLEKNGWEGVCIEANPEYWYRLASFRTCTIIGAAVGGKPEDNGLEVNFALKGVLGGVVGHGTDNNEDNSANVVQVKRNLVSILTIFNQTNVPKVIDYMSLDVEGAESMVMEHFPWSDYSFKFLTIERPKDDLKEKLKLNGYKMVLVLTLYGETLWIHQPSVLLPLEEIWTIAGEYNNTYFSRVIP
ncbi:hypothetical protein ACHAW5_008780 [Stephanodiscus triporus]|uniref:Methyltransferase FkbM domain-containing protein n=1 Tax=Stephanodiscus triporus TaxID=2934178 RepID=A0ABD3N0Y9_9STRA